MLKVAILEAFKHLFAIVWDTHARRKALWNWNLVNVTRAPNSEAKSNYSVWVLQNKRFLLIPVHESLFFNPSAGNLASGLLLHYSANPSVKHCSVAETFKLCQAKYFCFLSSRSPLIGLGVAILNADWYHNKSPQTGVEVGWKCLERHCGALD